MHIVALILIISMNMKSSCNINSISNTMRYSEYSNDIHQLYPINEYFSVYHGEDVFG